MAKKINNSTQTLGFKIMKARPVDDRSQFSTVQDLMDFVATSYEQLYDGIEIYVDETNVRYKWVENPWGLMLVGKTYATWDNNIGGPGGIDYVGKTYNFVISSDVVRYNITKTNDLNYIFFDYSKLPFYATQAGVITAELIIDGDTEVTYPDSIKWDVDKKLYIYLYPNILSGTSIKVKLS